MLDKLKRLITVGGWKSVAGGALILYSAYLSDPTCVDISCSQQVQQFYKAGEALLGVGLAHKLQKLSVLFSTLKQFTVQGSMKTP